MCLALQALMIQNSVDTWLGRQVKNVYCVPHQGGLSIYQIKNNEIVKTYKWLDSYAYDGNWRNLDKDK